MSVVGCKPDGELVPALAYLAPGRPFGHPIVGHGGGHDEDVGLGQALHHLGVHLSGRGSLDLADAGRRGHVHVGLDQIHLGAPVEGGPGQGEPHLARAAVADETHGIDGLPRATGGDDHAQAAQVALALHLQPQLHLGHDAVGVGHPPRAVDAAGQLAGARFHHEHPSVAQQAHVALGGRVLPHVGVHGRSDHHGLGEGQAHGGEEIVGDAVGHLGQRVGRGRSDDHDVGLLAVFDVSDARIRAQLTDLDPGGPGCPERVSKVMGPTNCVAARVMITRTSMPAFCRPRSSSAAL